MVIHPSRPLSLVGLLLPALVTSAAVIALPRFSVDVGVGLVIASAVAVVPAVVALRIAADVNPKSALPSMLGAASAIALTVLYFRGLTTLWLLPLQNVALVSVGHAVGNGIGKRIEHPGHVLPAMFVAAAADVASVLHPSGPSHAIASSDRALGALALAVPLPSDQGFTFVLGAGDLVFAALLFGVAVRHRISVTRVAALVLVGVAIALACAALVGDAVPALVPIGIVTVALVPRFRRLAPRDRTTTFVAVALSISVVAGLYLRARLSGG